LRLKELAKYTVEDGVLLGEMLMGSGTKSTSKFLGGRQERTSRLVDFSGLREVAEAYPWFASMVEAVLKHKLMKVNTSVVEVVALDGLRERDGHIIGSAFAMIIATAQTSAAAADEWIVHFDGLKEFDKKFKWFRPMVSVIAQRTLARVSWGLTARVSGGVAISAVGIISNLVVMNDFLQNRETSTFALITAGCLITRVICQSTLAFFQNRKAGSWWPMINEQITVFLFMKSVANGKDEQPIKILLLPAPSPSPTSAQR
jgi:hypothetical protein